MKPEFKVGEGPGVKHLFCWCGSRRAERLWNSLEQQLLDLADGFQIIIEVAAPLEVQFCGVALGFIVACSA